MEHSYICRGGIASASVISFAISENNAWAHALLSQCYCVPESIRTALLNGEAEWQIPNVTTLIITLVESQ